MSVERHTSSRHCVYPPPPSLALPGWQYSLHLYIDYGFPLSMLPTAVSALPSSFPFFRLTHSQLSPLQHVELLFECWERERSQLNGLSVLDVLEHQWHAGRVARVEASNSTAASNEQRLRKRRRLSESSGAQQSSQQLSSSRSQSELQVWQGAGRAAERPQQRNEAALDGSSGPETAVAVSAGGHFPPSLRASSYRRADYVVATHFSAASAAASSQMKRSRSPATSASVTLRSLLGSARYQRVSSMRQSNVDAATRTVSYSLILTEYDCYVPGLTFVFGVARLSRCALVSLSRLGCGSSDSTAAFLAKECVHEVGHLFSLHHCALPCVMTYSTTVEEALQKDSQLCPACTTKLQWMRHGVIIQPPTQQQPTLGSVEAAVEAQERAAYR